MIKPLSTTGQGARGSYCSRDVVMTALGCNCLTKPARARYLLKLLDPLLSTLLLGRFDEVRICRTPRSNFSLLGSFNASVLEAAHIRIAGQHLGQLPGVDPEALASVLEPSGTLPVFQNVGDLRKNEANHNRA